MRALIRSDNGTTHARLLEVTVTADGVSYHVVAERPGFELDEFVISDDLSTVALLWNLYGCSELQIMRYTDRMLSDPIPLPGLVAGELSISAGGAMVALTVQSPSQPRTVELVDTRTLEWEPVDRAPMSGPVGTTPTLETFAARDGLTITGWRYAPRRGARRGGVHLPARRAGGAVPARLQRDLPAVVGRGDHRLRAERTGLGGLGREFMHADDREKRFAAIDDVADCVKYLVSCGYADPSRIACGGWSYGGYLTLAALTFHPELFAAGVSICGMSDLNSFYRNTEAWIAAAAYPKYGHPVSDYDLLESLSPLPRADALIAPLLLIHGGNDTNVPVSESEQMYEALLERGRTVRYLLFEDDGHEIAKRENRARMADEVRSWLGIAFSRPPGA